MGRKSRQITGRYKTAEDHAREVSEPKPEPVRLVESAPPTSVVKFKGNGTFLLCGQMVTFANGEYSTSNEKTIAALDEKGFERL